MEESSANSLLCNEDESCFIGSDVEDDGCCHESSQTDVESVVLLGVGDEDEYIEILIQKETIHESETSVSPPPLFGHSIDSLSWRGKARLDSIEWILDVRLLTTTCLIVIVLFRVGNGISLKGKIMTELEFFNTTQCIGQINKSNASLCFLWC